jgi:4-cresol dehydrogenase (hydroxylating)
VLLGHDDIQRYSQSTIPAEIQVVAILLPGSVEDIQAVVNIARTYNIPLYTVSKGKNWGYGSACPGQQCSC